MNKDSFRSLSGIAACVLAAGLLVLSLKLPVWHLKMESPQYKDEEALRVRVYPGSMAGDLREINVLNRYIGVHIPEHLSELRWLPICLLVGAGLGLAATVFPRAFRSRLALSSAVMLTLSVVAAAAVAQSQMHQIGHQRDAHTVLKGVHDFTPPLLGHVKVANFEITAGLDKGAWLIAGAIALQLSAGWMWRRSPIRAKAAGQPPHKGSALNALLPSACSHAIL